MPNISKNSFNFSYLFKNITTRWYFYLIAFALILTAFLSLLLIKGEKKRNSLSKTQKIAYTAILSSLCFVFNAITIPVSNLIQISFIATIGFVAGYILGPGLGFVSAFIGDFLCAIVFPLGPYSPIINVGTALWGYIPGLLFALEKGNETFKISLTFILGFILNSFFVNTIGLTLMYGTPFNELLILLPIKFLVVVINFVISLGIAKFLKRVLPKNKFYL